MSTGGLNQREWSTCTVTWLPAAAVEVRADPLDRAWVLVGAAGTVEGEGCIGVVGVPK